MPVTVTGIKVEERAAYLSLALAPGIGVARLRKLIDRFESAATVFGASRTDLLEVLEGSEVLVAAVLQSDRGLGAETLEALARYGGRLLLPDDPDFPLLLTAIPDAPAYLFVQGDVALLSRPAIAIVGSRSHTQYGAEVCRSLARGCAEAGLVVVSGMARGLDALAHRGALESTGHTIGVLGNGLGVQYPASNRPLYAEVLERGLLLTEFLPGERPLPGGFQRRNRLISGLAKVTIVVEAAEKSGALITSDRALDQGRTVMAVPGPITSLASGGTNRLLRDGAGPVLDLGDVLGHYPELANRANRANGANEGPVSPLMNRLLSSLGTEPLGTEDLVELSDAPVSEALDALSALELSGRVRQIPGGRYRAVTELFGSIA